MRPYPYSVAFHHFYDGRRYPAGGGAITASELAFIIDYLSPQLLPAHLWLEKALTGKLTGGEVCLSFDDGLRCQYELALPVLEAYGLTAFWFVPSLPLTGAFDNLELYRHFRHACYPSLDDFYHTFYVHAQAHPLYGEAVSVALVSSQATAYLADFTFYSLEDRRYRYLRDKILPQAVYDELLQGMIASSGLDLSALHPYLYMQAQDLRQLQAGGHIIGLHTHTHPTNITYLDRSAQWEEYAQNQTLLAQILGAPPVTMAHPFGFYNQTTLEVLRSLGVWLGFAGGLTENLRSWYEVPRYDQALLLQAIRDERP